MSSLVRVACNRAAVVTLIAGIGLSSIAALADANKYETVTLALADQQVTFQCPQGKAEQVNDRFYACKAIFNGKGEQRIADEYCKPLAIAQACSDKPVTMTH